MALDHSLYIPHCYDGAYRLWRSSMASAAFHVIFNRWIYFDYLDRRTHLPRWNFDAWHKGQLQGTGEVVYDEELAKV